MPGMTISLVFKASPEEVVPSFMCPGLLFQLPTSTPVDLSFHIVSALCLINTFLEDNVPRAEPSPSYYVLSMLSGSQ